MRKNTKKYKRELAAAKADIKRLLTEEHVPCEFCRYSAKLSRQKVTTKTKVTIMVVADDVETYYTETKYTRSSNHELVAGQEIGVI